MTIWTTRTLLYSKNISYDIREKESDVEWKAWCGIRDVFAHQYANIDYKIAWDTIQEDVPLLKAKIEEICFNFLMSKMKTN